MNMSNISKRMTWLVVAAGCTALVVLSVALTGCTQNPNIGFGSEVSLTQTTATNDLVVGTPSESSQEFTICNRTGQTVTAFALKLTTEEAFGESFIFQEWTEGQNLKVYFAEQKAVPVDKNLRFDVRLTLADGQELEIKDVGLLDFEKLNLRIDGASGLAYLESVNALSLPVSTLEQSIAEKAAAEEEARRAEEEAQARAEAEAAAAAQAAAAATTSSRSSSSSNAGSGYSYNSSSSGSSGSVNQSSDVCVDDIILR
ncbi:MAG: hypothetical protein LBL27_00185 [Coriobacteriales bacterium]|jgi:hypothetical protein|nr:hypothetical protein [Coriobacteriales bacterium]